METNMRKRLKLLWNDQRGSGMILAVGLTFLLFAVSTVIIESLRMNSMAEKIRSEVQAATVECCAEQYTDVYNGIREGYSGGYAISNGHWSDDLSPADVYARINEDAGTTQDGDGIAKYAGTSVDYRLSGLSAQITNAPFAPDGTNTSQLTCTASVDVEVPLLLHWSGIPPMHSRINIESGYTPKFGG